MSTFFNLLRNVERDELYQYSFLARLRQTYRLFTGQPLSSNDFTMRPHFGLFDYLTLGIHALIEFCFDGVLSALDKAADNDEHVLGILLSFLLFLVGVIHVPLKLTNILFGVIATLISLPCMAITHLVLAGRHPKIKTCLRNEIPAIDEIIEHYGSYRKTSEQLDTRYDNQSHASSTMLDPHPFKTYHIYDTGSKAGNSVIDRKFEYAIQI